ncbi:MAG: arylsulfatase [Planctomycetales bacterium]|nr:arylsulfatase [Planctomycetales bacterium]
MMPHFRWVVLLVFLTASTGLAANHKHIVLIVADDLGYSDLGCFGSEIPTPNIDRLASQGMVLTDFYTAPTCSPTRAMLLTGVDHHIAGMGNMVEFRTLQQAGERGYEGFLNDRVVCVAETLRKAGYYTAMAGKWHLGYREGQIPAAKGFQRSWALLNGFADHFRPGPSRVFTSDGEYTTYPSGTYATEHYTNKAIEFVREAHAQGKPMFLYVAYTAPHWPLQAPQETVAKYRGKYDKGYDWLRKQRTAGLEKRKIVPAGIKIAASTELRPYLHESVPVRPHHVNWNDLSPQSQAIEASKMEVYAAMVDSLDQQVGRLFDVLRELDMYDDSLICFMSDNGAAPSEATGGGYGPDWAKACTGPFRLVKGYPTEGGTKSPCIIKSPSQNQRRTSNAFASVLDFVPTAYDFAGVTVDPVAPLAPLEGRSMMPLLTGKRSTIHPKNHGMGWELFGRGAYRLGPWKIVSVEQPFGKGQFELFDLRHDLGEANDLSDKRPDVMSVMLQRWNEYAKRVNVVSIRSFHESEGEAHGSELERQ